MGWILTLRTSRKGLMGLDWTEVGLGSVIRSYPITTLFGQDCGTAVEAEGRMPSQGGGMDRGEFQPAEVGKPG